METLQGGHRDNKHPTCFLPVLQPLLGLHGLTQLEVRGQVVNNIIPTAQPAGHRAGSSEFEDRAHWGEGMDHSNGGDPGSGVDIWRGGRRSPVSVLPSGTGGFLGPLSKQVAHVEGHKLLAFAHRCRVLSPSAAPSQPRENGAGC